MAKSIEMMSRWAWLTICAILLGWALALGYLLIDTQERLGAAQSTLAVAKEHESQAAAQIVQLKDAASALKSQLSELENHANLTEAQRRQRRAIGLGWRMHLPIYCRSTSGANERFLKMRLLHQKLVDVR